MDLKDKRQEAIDYLELCRKKLKDHGEDDSNTFVVFGYILELLEPAEQNELEKINKILKENRSTIRLAELHLKYIKRGLPGAIEADLTKLLRILDEISKVEPEQTCEPLNNDQILTVFGKYAECIYDRDDYYISGGKFIDAVKEIVSSLKPEPTCEIVPFPLETRCTNGKGEIIIIESLPDKYGRINYSTESGAGGLMGANHWKRLKKYRNQNKLANLTR